MQDCATRKSIQVATTQGHRHYLAESQISSTNPSPQRTFALCSKTLYWYKGLHAIGLNMQKIPPCIGDAVVLNMIPYMHANTTLPAASHHEQPCPGVEIQDSTI